MNIMGMPCFSAIRTQHVLVIFSPKQSLIRIAISSRFHSHSLSVKAIALAYLAPIFIALTSCSLNYLVIFTGCQIQQTFSKNIFFILSHTQNTPSDRIN